VGAQIAETKLIQYQKKLIAVKSRRSISGSDSLPLCRAMMIKRRPIKRPAEFTPADYHRRD
jgi:hypothetical protein